MYSSTLVLVALNVLFFYSGFVVKADTSQLIEKNIGKCHQSDPDFNQCLIDLFNELHPIITHGIPEWNIKSSDPMYIDKLVIDKFEGVNFKQVLTNITITGLKNSKVIRGDFSKLPLSFEMTWETPRMRIENDYVMDGVILGLPIRGKGHASVNATTLRNKMKFKNELIKKNGEDYLQIKEVKYTVETPKTVHVHFTNTLTKDKNLNDAMNKFFNDNWRSLFDMMKSHREGQLESIVKDGVNSIWARYPYKQLFPQ